MTLKPDAIKTTDNTNQLTNKLISRSGDIFSKKCFMIKMLVQSCTVFFLMELQLLVAKPSPNLYTFFTSKTLPDVSIDIIYPGFYGAGGCFLKMQK